MKIGIALGSGSARGWSHLGVFKALQKLGIQPDIVAGASVGSLVGAAYACDKLDELETWACGLSRIDVWRLLDARLSGGVSLIKGDRLMRAISGQLPDRPIENLPIPYATVATDLNTGTEVWIKEGSMHEAIRASSGFPGLFAPVLHSERWLIDGGVVNPVPVSLCRALGADFVIAVNLNRRISRRLPGDEPESQPGKTDDEDDSQTEEPEMLKKWTQMLNSFFTQSHADAKEDEPGMVEVMSASINIMQDRITRSRMVGDPPDAVISPAVDSFQLMDFHRAKEAIEAGLDAVHRARDQLRI